MQRQETNTVESETTSDGSSGTGPGPAPNDTIRSDTADARLGGHRQRQSVLPGRAATAAALRLLCGARGGGTAAWSESSDPKEILTSRRQALGHLTKTVAALELKSSKTTQTQNALGVDIHVVYK